MELASFLAGEPWSDHPSCTHPLLASLARDVNDHVDDYARTRLAPLIPEVIGLNGDDPRVDAWIAREAALTALPVTAVRAAGCRGGRAAALRADAQPARGPLQAPRRPAHRRPRLDAAPHARDWARGFTALGWGSAGSFAKRSAPAIVHSAVSGIAAAAVPDADELLVDLLERTIVLCRGWFGHETAGRPGPWREASRLTQRRLTGPEPASSRASASATSAVMPANDSRTNRLPTSVSKSTPGAVAMPVSASSRWQKAIESSVRWPTSAYT